MTDQAELTVDLVIAQGQEQVSTVVDDKAVIMSVDNGKYYNMDDIGTRIWSLIETPTSIGAVCARMAEEFEVEGERCKADVLDLLARLRDYGLIRVVS